MMQNLRYIVPVGLSIATIGIIYLTSSNKYIPHFKLLLNKEREIHSLFFPETSVLKDNFSVTPRDGFNDSLSWNCSAYRWQGSNEVTVEKHFQKWLYLFHNDCHRPKCDIDTVLNAGIGAGINIAVVSLGLCLAKGAIFHPGQRWIWAVGPPRCHAPTYDCYTLPTTNCSQFNVSGPITSPNEYVSGFEPLHTSPCALAAEAKAPLMWVYGQLVKYLTRADGRMQSEVSQLRDEIMYKVSDKPKPRYLAAHVRGGHPDGGRKPIPIDRYLTVIDAQANALARSGVEIDFVYLSGDSINSRVNVAELNRSPHRSFKFVTPNFTDTGNEEVELVMRRTPGLREKLVREYYLDLEMYAGAEAFIGVHSNVWPLIQSLRVSSNRRGNCMFDSHSDPPKFYCDYCDPKIWYTAFKLSC